MFDTVRLALILKLVMTYKNGDKVVGITLFILQPKKNDPRILQEFGLSWEGAIQ